MLRILGLVLTLAAISLAAGLVYLGEPSRQRRRTALRFLIPLLLSQVGSAILFYLSSIPPRQAERFQSSFDREIALKKDPEFVVMNPDSVLWGRPDTPGCLTLWTHQADPWTKPGELGEPRNIVSRPCDAPRFVAEVHIQRFAPRWNWQQAGLIIFKDMDNYVRLTVAASSNVLEKTGNEPILHAQAVLEHNGKPFEVKSLRITRDGFTPRFASSGPLEHTALRIRRNVDQWQFAWWNPFLTRWESILAAEYSFEPQYIGLVAFHGISDNEQRPLLYAPIPCDIDAFSIEPLW